MKTSSENKSHSNRRRISLAVLSAFPIGLGLLKLYSHLNSVWRFSPLDYLVSAGLVLGGLFLFSKSRSRATLAISSIFLVVEFLKAIIDYSDTFDLFITVMAIVYLCLPFLRYFFADHYQNR